jgi:hypothetical protein
MKVIKLTILLMLHHLIALPSFAETNYSYNARIQCGNSSVTNNEYFYAASDMAAKNEVMRLLNNNTGYKGRGC